MLTPDPPVLAQKYRLIRQLEVGGMASVWLAEHVHLGSMVAVKLMGREVAATAIGTQRFLREARTAASLRSPNVVQILDYGVHDGTPFIAMELLVGESLAARLDREGRFQSWERAERVLRDVARAVGRAHDAGIIHRDLKPANIFLVRDEEEEVVKLLDFGIAKTTVEQLNVPGAETRTGEFLGSPTYSSPEQLQVSKTLDHRADIWSLGIIAYECFLGEPPFVSETLVGLVLDICSNAMPIPSRHGPVPAGFDAWFARACSRDVEQRFPDVREASAELRRLVAAACAVPASLSEAPPAPSALSAVTAALPSPPASPSEAAPPVASALALPSSTLRSPHVAGPPSSALLPSSSASPPAPPTSSAWPPAPASLSEAPLPTTPLPFAPAALAHPPAALALPPWVLLPEPSSAPRALRTEPTVRQPGRTALLRARFGTALARRSETNGAGTDAPSSERWSERRMPALLLTGLALLAVPLFWFALRAPAPLARLQQDVQHEDELDERVLGLAPPTPSDLPLPSPVPAGSPAVVGSDVPAPTGAAPSDPSVPADELARGAAPVLEEPALGKPASPDGSAHGAKPARSVKPAQKVKPARSAKPAASAVSPSAGLASSGSSLTPESASPSAPPPSAIAPSAPPPSAIAPSAPPPSAIAPSAPSAPAAPPSTRVAAPRRQARLTLTSSTPSTVLLDGKGLGTTPLADVSVPPGVHEVTFESDGERSTQKVEIRAGEHKRVHAGPEVPRGDGLDEAAVQHTLRAYAPSVRDICWERALRGQPPEAAGTSVRVTARITVEPSGRVRSVTTSGAPTNYPGLPRCIEEKVRAWSFPRALGETVVNVPFVFVDG